MGGLSPFCRSPGVRPCRAVLHSAARPGELDKAQKEKPPAGRLCRRQVGYALKRPGGSNSGHGISYAKSRDIVSHAAVRHIF